MATIPGSTISWVDLTIILSEVLNSLPRPAVSSSPSSHNGPLYQKPRNYRLSCHPDVTYKDIITRNIYQSGSALLYYDRPDLSRSSPASSSSQFNIISSSNLPSAINLLPAKWTMCFILIWLLNMPSPGSPTTTILSNLPLRFAPVMMKSARLLSN